MRKILLFALGLVMAMAAMAQEKLIISEVSGGKIGGVYHKYIEIYNAGDVAIDLTAGNYYVGLETNANVSVSPVFKLEGSIDSKAVMLIASAALDYEAVYGITPIIWTGIAINGDDRVFLLKGGDTDANIIDAFGVKAEDGTGKDWEYSYGVATRKSPVTEAKSVFDIAQWEITKSAADDKYTPGTHTTGAIVLSGKYNIVDNTEKVEVDFKPTVSFTKAIRNIDDSEITNDNIITISTTVTIDYTFMKIFGFDHKTLESVQVVRGG